MTGGTNTVAAARSNAMAILHVIRSPNAQGNQYREDITDEELGRHRFFNDDIVGFAEQLASYVTARDNLVAALAVGRQQQADFMALATSTMGDPRAGEAVRNAERERMIADYNNRIVAVENEIRAEFEHIENQHRLLANNLNDGRERQAYLDALAVDNRWQGELELATNQYRRGMATPEQEQLAMIYGNLIPYAQQRSGSDLPEEIHAAQTAMRRFNRYWVDYRLLQAGASIRVHRIPWSRIIMGAIVIVILEVVTAGAINYAFAAAAAGGRMIAVSSFGARVGAHLVRRYNQLPGPIKNRLDDLFENRQRSNRAETESPGETIVDSDAPSPAVARQVCRGC